jgi:hypothetical protein
LEVGTFSVAGSTLRLETSEDSRYCAGTTAVYEASFSDAGDALQLTLVEDPCSARSQDLRKPIRKEP